MKKLLLILAIALFQVQHAMAAEPEAQPQSVETVTKRLVVGTLTPYNTIVASTFCTETSAKFTLSADIKGSHAAIPLTYTVRQLYTPNNWYGEIYTGTNPTAEDFTGTYSTPEYHWSIEIQIRPGEAHLYNSIEIVVSYDI